MSNTLTAMKGDENWKRVRDYAMGKQDISKYKEQLKSSHTQSSYIKIDWSPRKLMKRVMRKLLNSPSLRNHRFVARLFRASKK